MPKINFDKVINNRETYHRFIYIIMFVLAIISRGMNMGMTSSYTILSCIAIVSMFIFELLVGRFFSNEADIITVLRLLELIVVLILEYMCKFTNYYWIAWMILSMVIGMEYIVQENKYDKITVGEKKTVVNIMLIAVAIVTYSASDITAWAFYLMIKLIVIFLMNYFVNYFDSTSDYYAMQMNQMHVKLSGYEDDNTKLIEYQERVKEINEQINYQKIDLTRAYRDLEQINQETKAQAEIMKYMSSTFDIPKCVNVITDTIMEVKEPKLCAMYIDKNIYNNQFGYCVIKTNYSSMQRRLKKDIEDIFDDLNSNNAGNIILHEESVKRYRFVGDTNIDSMAILPIKEGRRMYGFMLVASDEENFFDNGLDFYENCLVEFNVSVKSTKLYLKTQDMARKDGLTGIYNRVYFGELFDKAVKTAVSKGQFLSVALFDIDKFKSVNDTYGHIAGDKVIKMVAQVAEKYAQRYSGFTCRYGGEEFLLVYPGKDEQETLKILEEFHEEIKSTTVIHEDFKIDVNICIGLSSYPNICKKPEMLVNRADISMYYGKRHGRGRLVLDNPLVDEGE